MKKLVLIDGNSLMFRSYYATAYTGQLMQNKHGIFTNAIYGFCNMLTKIQEEEMSHIFVAFDAGSQTFRHKEYEEYKKTRKALPDELLMQIPYIKKYLDILNIKRHESLDYEADDIIASLTKLALKDGFNQIDIITGDKDMLQLVSEKVNVLITIRGATNLEEYNQDNFYDKMEIYPSQVTDYKGLVGDTSDNLPGIKGIGNKTAIKLLSQFKNLENIIANTSLIKGKVSNSIQKEYKIAIKTKKLSTLKDDIEFNFTLEATKLKEYDHNELISFYKELEFSSLLDKMDNKRVSTDFTFKIIDDEKFDFSVIKDGYINIEIFGNNYLHGEILGLSIVDRNHNYFITKKALLNNKSLHAYLKSDYKKYSFDIKKLYLVLKINNIEITNLVFDALLAGYLIDPSYASEDLKKLANELINTDLNFDDAIYGANKKAKIPDEKVYAKHAVNKALVIRELVPVMEKKLKEYELEELFMMELDLSIVLANMEIDGLKVNRKTLTDLGAKIEKDQDEVAERIYELAGETFNINSVKQLRTILFDKLGLPPTKKTKTGYSTSSEVLEKLSDYEIANLILEYREYNKLNSTYIKGMIEVMNDDDYIHPLYKQALTMTGRLSSVEPNIQNMPIRTKLGQIIRKAFVSRFDNGVILSSDYSQIELRVLAHISKDENMIAMFNDKVDFHTQTAARIYEIDIKDVDAENRRTAKAINFGIIYGMSAWGLSEALKISAEDAHNYIERYFTTFNGVKDYLDKTIEDATKNGYTKTLYNRRRYLPELNSSNKALKAFGERTAMNSPIQGTAADIIKIAMVNVAKNIKNMKSKLIAQVHDELLFDVHPEEIDKIQEIVKRSMESVAKLKVPLIVDISYGDNWLEV